MQVKSKRDLKHEPAYHFPNNAKACNELIEHID
jgi:hypothetical protein